MKSSIRKRFMDGLALLTSVSALMVMLGAPAARAAGTATWVGNSDANWNTAANWSTVGGSTPPANGDSLVFGAAGAAGASLNNNISSLSVNNLTINSGASAFTMSGNGITLTGTLTDGASVDESFNGISIGSGVAAAIKNIGSGTLALGALTPLAGGTVLLTTSSPISTTTADGWDWRAPGFGANIGGWVVIDNGNNTYDWARSGASGINNIVIANYQTGGTGNRGNVKHTSGTTSFNVNGSWVSINLQGASTVLNINGTQVYLDTGGLILSGGATLGGSKRIMSNSGKFYVYVPDSGVINNSSGLQNNGSTAATLIKSGSGTLSLPSANTYTGGAVLYAGTVSVGNAGAFGTTAGTLTLSGGNLDCSSANLTLNSLPQAWNADFAFVGSQSLSLGTGAVTLSAPRQVTITANTLTVGGVIGSGSSYGLTKAGTGTLKLTGVNGYTGATIVNAGTLQVSTAGTGIASGSAVTVNANGILLVDSGATIASSSVSVTGSGATVSGAGTISGNTIINSSGALTPRPGGGSATTINFGGNLTLSSASANFNLSATGGGSNDKVNYGSSSTLTLDNTDTINITGTPLDAIADYTLFTSIGGTVSMATAPALYVNGVLSDQTTPGSYQLNISGGSLVLHYIQAATPPTVNSANASPTSLGHHEATTVTVNVTPASGKSITSVGVDGLGGAGNPVALTGPGGDGTGNWTGTFTVPGALVAGSYTLNGFVNQNDGGVSPWSVSDMTVTNTSQVWSGGGSDNKWSTGGNWGSGYGPGNGDVVAFEGTSQVVNNMDISITLSSLTFNSGAAEFVITNATNTLTLSGGLTNNSTSVQTVDVPVALSGGPTVNAAAGDVIISCEVSGSGALSKSGDGTLTLSGANSYSGGTTLSNGVVIVGQATGLGTGTVTFNNGTLENSVAMTVANTMVLGSAGTISNAVAQDLTLSGILSGPGALSKSGDGALILSGANTYTGGTVINSGTLSLNNATALGTGSFTLNGGTVIANNGSMNYGGAITVNGSVGFYCTANLTTTGALAGSGTLNNGAAQGAASWNLSGDLHDFSGTIAYTAGGNYNNFNIGGGTANSMNLSQAKVVISGTIGFRNLSFNGTGASVFQVGDLSGTGGRAYINNSGIALAVGNLGLDSTYAGELGGSGAFTKVGVGILTLSGASSYTGNTTVSNGTLVVNGTLASNGAVEVASGATLAGSGTIAGTIDVASNAVLTAGNPAVTNRVGTLNATASATLAAGAVYAVRIGADGCDTLNAAGGLILSTGANLEVCVDPALGRVPLGYELTVATGPITGQFNQSVINLPNQPLFKVSYGSNAITLLSVGGTIIRVL